MKDHAAFAGLPETVGKRVRDEFFLKVVLNPDQVKELLIIQPEAVTLKYIAAPLSCDQLKELMQIPPRKKM
jgi:NitT/TauT family transport system substrate-binding protein